MPPPHDDDVELLRRVVRRDAAAVRELLDGPAAVVYGFVYARVGGDESAAGDLVQETLFEAVKSADRFRGEAALATWLCTIAKRRLARHYERERREEIARSGLRLVQGELTDEPDEIDSRDEMVRALGKLSALHRQVLVLKYLDGCTVAEIADAVGRTRVQVQSLLQRARDSLRRELENTA